MDALFVMCPQNSFLSKTGTLYMGDRADDLVVRLADYLSTFKGPRIFFREKHSQGDSFFRFDKTHSVVSTEDYGIESSLRTYANIIFEKTRYSAFYNTNLDGFLVKEKIRDVGVVGLETHTSILFTVEELINRGINVILIEPCTASRDQHMHDTALSLMGSFLGVRISNG